MVASSFLFDFTRNSVDTAMTAKVVASMASINPRNSSNIGTTAKSSTNSELRFIAESSGRADTQNLPITAANAAATGRTTNFPVSIIASSERKVAAKNNSSNPANTAGAETRPLYWPTFLVFPFS